MMRVLIHQWVDAKTEPYWDRGWDQKWSSDAMVEWHEEDVEVAVMCTPRRLVRVHQNLGDFRAATLWTVYLEGKPHTALVASADLLMIGGF